MSKQIQFHDEDQDSVKLIGAFFAKNNLIEKVEYTSDIDPYASHDIVLTTVTGSKVYVEVKDRRDHITHKPKNHWNDVIIDELKKNRFEQEGILTRVVVAAIWDDGISLAVPTEGKPMTKTLPRWSQSKSYVYNKTSDENYMITKNYWSMPIKKFIEKDLRINK